MRSRQRGKRPTPSQIAVKAHFVCAGPQFYHPVFRLNRRGMAPDYCRFGRSIGSNAIGRSESPREPKINQMVSRRHPQRRLRKISVSCRHFFTAWLRRSLSNYRRLFDAVSWLGGGRAASICPVDRVDGAIAVPGANCAGRSFSTIVRVSFADHPQAVFIGVALARCGGSVRARLICAN